MLWNQSFNQNDAHPNLHTSLILSLL